MWAVIQVARQRHVVPVDDDNRTDHSLSMDCRCNPRIDEEDKNLIIHEEIN